MRYSKKMNTFYPETLDYPVLPDDLIDVSDDDFERVNARAPGETFEFVDGKLVIHPVPEPSDEQRLANARDTSHAAINAWRDQQESAGFDWNGHHWDSDPESRDRIMSVALANIAPPNGYWTDANNVDVPMTDPADMHAMYAAMITRGAQIHDRQREMKREVETMSLEQLQTFQPDWPAQP